MRHILLILFMGITFSCFSQDQEQKQVTLYTIQDEVLFGKLVSISVDSLVLDHKDFGILRIARSNIKRLHDGKRLPLNYSTFGDPYYVPTGIANGKGNHYYRNYALFGNNFSFGLNDHVDVSLGVELISLFINNSSSNPWPITQLGIKVSESFTDNFHVGLSTRAIFNGEGGIVLASLPFTFGSMRNNFTFAPSVGFLLGEDDRDYVSLFNANITLSNKLRLVTDGLYSEGFLLATTMVEIQTKYRLIISVGAIYSTEFTVLPNFAITVPFAKKSDQKTILE